MKKIQYNSKLDIQKVLTAIYMLDPHNHDDAYEMLVLYVMHKSGLIEDGINEAQMNAACDAFAEGMESMAELIDMGVAHYS